MKTTITLPCWLITTVEVAEALANVAIGIACWIGFGIGCLTTAVAGGTLALAVIGLGTESLGILLPWLTGLLGHGRILLVSFLMFGFTPYVRDVIGWPRIKLERKPEF